MDYEQIRRDNIRRFGEDTYPLYLLCTEIYKQSFHFVHELIQNADDALASRVCFILADDALVVFNNGRDFTEENVRRITAIEQQDSTNAREQIGKFGIGFKSVYSFTDSPEVYSGNELFRIESYVRPFALDHEPNDIAHLRRHFGPGTYFRFPLRKKVTEDLNRSYSDQGLARSLLFLRAVRQIEFYTFQPDKPPIPETSLSVKVIPHELTDVSDGTSLPHLPVMKVICTQGRPDEYWLQFYLDNPKLSIAFLTEQSNAGYAIKPIDSTTLYLYTFLPTMEQTGCRFLINGPFDLTPSRDSLKDESTVNGRLLSGFRGLLEEMWRYFELLKQSSILTREFFNALDVNLALPAKTIAKTLDDLLVDTVKGKAVFPTTSGEVASADQCVVASSFMLKVTEATDFNRKYFVDPEIARSRFLRKVEELEFLDVAKLEHLLHEWRSSNLDRLCRFYEALSSMPSEEINRTWVQDPSRKFLFLQYADTEILSGWPPEGVYFPDSKWASYTLHIIPYLEHHQTVAFIPLSLNDPRFQKAFKNIGVREFDQEDFILKAVVPLFHQQINGNPRRVDLLLESLRLIAATSVAMSERARKELQVSVWIPCLTDGQSKWLKVNDRIVFSNAPSLKVPPNGFALVDHGNLGLPLLQIRSLCHLLGIKPLEDLPTEEKDGEIELVQRLVATAKDLYPESAIQSLEDLLRVLEQQKPKQSRPDSKYQIIDTPETKPQTIPHDLQEIALEQLHSLITDDSPLALPQKTRALSSRYTRGQLVKVYVLRRAKGQCEICLRSAPFRCHSDHRPYLEVHHVKPLSEGGKDHPVNAVAVCPNCHKEMEYGENKERLRRKAVSTIKSINVEKA